MSFVLVRMVTDQDGGTTNYISAPTSQELQEIIKHGDIEHDLVIQKLGETVFGYTIQCQWSLTRILSMMGTVHRRTGPSQEYRMVTSTDAGGVLTYTFQSSDHTTPVSIIDSNVIEVSVNHVVPVEVCDVVDVTLSSIQPDAMRAIEPVQVTEIHQ